MGWWWYVGTLAPVVGIIPGRGAGLRRSLCLRSAHRDLHCSRLVGRSPDGRTGPSSVRRAVVVAGMAWIAALTVATRAPASVLARQRSVIPARDPTWFRTTRSRTTIWEWLLSAEGRMAEALGHFQEAVETRPPRIPMRRSNLGNAPSRAEAARRRGHRVREGLGAISERRLHPLQPRHGARRSRARETKRRRTCGKLCG
jgi:hypothetical protein